MTRALSATFLLFYATFTVVISVERTAETAITLARDSATSGRSVRSASASSSFVRIHEEPFASIPVVTAFALDDAGLAAPGAALAGTSGECRRYTPCRAPPALL